MSLDNALFLVNRSGTNYKVSGANIGSKILNGDSVLVQKGFNRFRAVYGNSSWGNIGDSDLLLAWDGSNNRKVTGANFKDLFDPPGLGTLTLEIVQFQAPWRTGNKGEYLNSHLIEVDNTFNYNDNFSWEWTLPSHLSLSSGSNSLNQPFIKVDCLRSGTGRATVKATPKPGVIIDNPGGVLTAALPIVVTL